MAICTIFKIFKIWERWVWALTIWGWNLAAFLVSASTSILLHVHSWCKSVKGYFVAVPTFELQFISWEGLWETQIQIQLFWKTQSSSACCLLPLLCETPTHVHFQHSEPGQLGTVNLAAGEKHVIVKHWNAQCANI